MKHAREIKPKKAPGLDGIPPEAIQQPNTAARIPGNMEDCKGSTATQRRKNGGNITGYRTICLLSVLGKLYERLITGRIEEELERNNLAEQ